MRVDTYLSDDGLAVLEQTRELLGLTPAQTLAVGLSVLQVIAVHAQRPQASVVMRAKDRPDHYLDLTAIGAAPDDG